MIYVFIQVSRLGLTFTPPADWTLVDSDTASLGSYLYRKTAASEGSTFTFTTSVLGNTTYIGICVALRDTAGAGNPTQDAYTETIDTSADTTADNTGVTPTTSPGGMLLAFIGSVNIETSYSAYAVATSNPSWTEGADIAASGGGDICSAALAYASRDFTTATGAFSATIANSAVTAVYLVAVKPAGFSIASPLATIDTTGFNPALAYAASVAMPVRSIVLFGPTPVVVETDPTVLNTSKTSASFINTSKNNTTATNTNKNSASWTNAAKNSV